MHNWEKVYEKWNAYADLDPSLRNELDTMKFDKNLLEEAFYKELTFGTGGMRGILGAGTNRMNIYTVRKAVSGLAVYLKENCVNVKDRGVVIAYDSRYMSKEFAVETAKVLGAHGMKAYVFDKLHPTPLLSFAVRYLGTVAGVMITASHNPPEYNGFKVYNEDGGQITPDEANAIIGYINQIDDELNVPIKEQEELEKKDLLTWVNDEIDNAYLEKLDDISKLDDQERNQAKGLPIVFTPLHGTAYDLVVKGLQRMQFQQVHVVKEQAEPDPEFSTVESPNPEEHQAFTMAIEQGEKVDAAILIGTDPDADRLGVAVKNQKAEYQVLTGNQLGSLMLDYILRHSGEAIMHNARLIKTIVTSELGRKIAESYGVSTIDTLTGFKFIGEKIRQFDATGETFVFGYEESYGYLPGSFVRDKDAVQSAVLACEMAYFWEKQGKTLLDALHDLYEKHGFYLEDMSSITLKGKKGAEQINHMMEYVRTKPLQHVGGLNVTKAEDYLASERTLVNASGKKEKIALPKENVVKYLLENDAWICLRPSGTEPKIKCYYGVCEATREKSEKRLAELKSEMESTLHQLVEE